MSTPRATLDRLIVIDRGWRLDRLEARQIAEAFALGAPTDGAMPVARGEMGRVRRLDADRGRYAVKELFYPSYARIGIASTTGEQRARMAYRIDELDRTLFTLGSIDRLLDALSS